MCNAREKITKMFKKNNQLHARLAKKFIKVQKCVYTRRRARLKRSKEQKGVNKKWNEAEIFVLYIETSGARTDIYFKEKKKKFECRRKTKGIGLVLNLLPKQRRKAPNRVKKKFASQVT